MSPLPDGDTSLRARMRWAKIGITVQFMALVRILAEYYRLRHVRGQPLSPSMVKFLLDGALIAALFCWLAVTLYFFARYRSATLTAAVTMIVLLAFKLLASP
jgi:preprotein translocase subunit SecD